jgi:pyruvate dehydrogenase E2 component (dihydrolipoamide acetyltransferase)
MTHHDLVLPDLPGGAATVLAWLAPHGEPLAAGTPMALLLTACAELLLPAPAAGSLAEPAAVGATVAPGELLARLMPAPKPTPEPEPTPPEARLRATPLARAIARRHDLDLAALAGSGPHGQIRAADVRALLSAATRAPSPLAYQASAPAAKLAAMPTATATLELDAGAALRRVAAEGAACARHGLQLGLAAVVLEAAAALLPAHGLLNASWAGEVALLRRRLHIAVGAPGPSGLRWALVCDAGDLTLRGLARAMATPSDNLDAATFAVVSLNAGAGWFGAQPPLPGTAATLSLGAPAARPVARADTITIRPIVALTLSYDARLIDHCGAVAFLQQLRARIEHEGQARPGSH